MSCLLRPIARGGKFKILIKEIYNKPIATGGKFKSFIKEIYNKPIAKGGKFKMLIKQIYNKSIAKGGKFKILINKQIYNKPNRTHSFIHAVVWSHHLKHFERMGVCMSPDRMVNLERLMGGKEKFK